MTACGQHGASWCHTARARTPLARLTLRPAEISRQNFLDGCRLDIELPEARQDPARCIVCLEKINLASGQRRVRQEFEQSRLRLCHREGHWHEQPLLADDT